MKRNDPRRMRKQRHQILEVAARFIAKNGYHGMSMRALAKATGKSLATAYNYFSSKEEILYALQKEAFESLIKAAGGALESVRDSNARLYVFILNHVSYFASHAAVMRVLIYEAGSLPPAKRTTIRRLKKRYFEIGRIVIEEVLREGCGKPGVSGRAAGETIDEAEIERITYSLFGMLNWTYTWYDPKRHGDVAKLAHTMRHLILCGAVAGCPKVAAPTDRDGIHVTLGAVPLLGGGDGSLDDRPGRGSGNAGAS